jgi:hypothetical protein
MHRNEIGHEETLARALQRTFECPRDLRSGPLAAYRAGPADSTF